MNLEKLIDQLPCEQQMNNGVAGFCLKYLTDKKVWVVGYGRKHVKDRYAGVGYSPIEAVLNFHEKLKNK